MSLGIRSTKSEKANSTNDGENVTKPDVCVISHQFNDLVGVTIMANLVDVLRPISNEIYVICGNFTETTDEKTHVINIKGVGPSETIFSLLFKQILVQASALFSLLRIVKTVDIIIFFLGGRVYVLPMLIAKIARRKTVVVAGGSAVETTRGQYCRRLFGLGGVVFPFIANILEKTNLALADQIAVETEGAVSLLGLDRYRHKIAIFGSMYVNTNVFNVAKDVATKKPLVGYVGRLSREKGVLNFVRAIPLILGRNYGAEFFIGGGGELLDEIKKKLKSDGLENKVTVAGWIPHEKLPDYLNRLKIIVVPSYTEGLPGVVQEAMACGVILVATSVGGIPDLVRDEQTGFILEDNSPECIAMKVSKALSSPNLDIIIRNARKLIEDQYSYQAMVIRFEEALYGLTRERRPS